MLEEFGTDLQSKCLMCLKMKSQKDLVWYVVWNNGEPTKDSVCFCKDKCVDGAKRNFAAKMGDGCIDFGSNTIHNLKQHTPSTFYVRRIRNKCS